MLFYCLDYCLVQEYKRIVIISDTLISFITKKDQTIHIKGTQLSLVFYSKEEIKIKGDIEEILFHD